MYQTTTKLKLKLTSLIKVTLWMLKFSTTILETKLLFQLMAKTHLVTGANTFIATGQMKYSKSQMDKVRFKVNEFNFREGNSSIFILTSLLSGDQLLLEYSRTSVAQTQMDCLPWLFQTHF